nr:MAG TPA: Minor structural protein putative tail fiber [Caudoviricetes sp.]
MGISNNSPTMSYIHASGISIVWNNETYMVQDFATNKKYIYWNADLPNQLNASNVMPNRSTKQYLVIVNDNGMSTLVPSTSDNFSISFDGNSNQAIKDRIFGLYEKNEQFGNKFVAIEQDINGIKQIVGDNGENSDGSLIDRISKIEQRADGIDLSVEKISKKYNDDKETNQLRENLNSSIIKLNSTLGTFKREVTDYFKNNEVTSEEKVKIETQLGILTNEKTILDGYVNTIKLIAENNNQTQNAIAIESAKQALQIAHDNLYNNIANVIIDSIITPTENTIIIDSFAKYNLRINELKKTCDDVIILGLGGVITEELANINIKSDEIKLSVSKVESDFKNDMSVQKIELESQIKDVSTALGTFKETVNTTFKDGIIDESEKQLLKEKIGLVDKEKVDIDLRYNSVVQDLNLSEEVKIELTAKYNEYCNKHNELKEKINHVISDNMVNDAEKLEIDTLFKAYSNSLAHFSALMNKAIENITFNTSKAELEQVKNELQGSIDGVKVSIEGIDKVLDGTFENNILDEVERENIKQNLENLSREKLDIDKTYIELYGNTYLTGQDKVNFKNSYDNYISKYNEVVKLSNDILAKEDLINNIDKANMDSAIAKHKETLALFHTQANKSIDIIATNKVNSVKNEIGENLDNLKGEIDGLDSYIDGAFKDSVLSDAEKNAIKQNLKTLETGKLNIDKQYTIVYNNASLTGTAKTELKSSYDNYVLKYNSLVTVINNILDKTGLLVEADNTAINNAFKEHNMAMSVYNEKINKAIDYITIKNVEDAKSELSSNIEELGGALNNLENTMNNAFKDGVLSESEKQSIKQHLLTVSSKKTDIDKRYVTLYSNEHLEKTPKTNLTTAYNNYIKAYNSLVTVINNILEKEGLVDSIDQTNLNNAFKEHDSKLGLYTTADLDALDAIAKKKAEVESEKVDKKYAEIILDPETGIKSMVGHLTQKIDGEGGIEQRLKTAEQSITPDGISQIVQDSQFIKDLEGKVTTNTSLVKQTASQLSSKVSNGEFESYKEQTASQIASKVGNDNLGSLLEQNPTSIQIGFNKINDTVVIDKDKMQFKDSAGNQSLSFMRGSLYAYEPNSSVFMGAGLIPRWNQGLYNTGFGVLAGANSYYYSIARANSWEADTQANPGAIDEYFIINYRDRGSDLSQKQGCHTYYKLYTSGGINGMGYDIENFANIKCLDLYAGTIKDTSGSTILTTNESSIASNKNWNFNYYTLSNVHLSNASLNTSQDCSVGSISTYTYKGSNGTTLFTSASICSNRVGWAWNNNNLLDPVIIGGSYGYSITPNTDTYSNVKTCNGDVNLDGILDKINIYTTQTTYKTNFERSLEIDVTELRESENADMFIKRHDTVNSETGESEIVENIDMKSMLHLALLEIKNLKEEVKVLKQKVNV